MRINLFNKKQRWICGRAQDGKTCRSGPDIQGCCHNHFECQPLKKGDRWYCSRPTPCQDGALPDGCCSQPAGLCQPQLSAKAKITRSTLWLLTLSLGLLLSMLAANAYSPGKLSLSHRFLETECQNCHSAGRLNALEVLYQAVKPFPHDQENKLCIDCHSLGKNASSAHSVAKAELDALTQKTRQRQNLSGLLMARHNDKANNDLGCMQCHREHQGVTYDLTALSDKNCQSCHQQTFMHFDDHPEFTQFPYPKHSNINFDHQAHIGKNFTEEDDLKQFAPKSCNDCHQPDSKGELMPIKGFPQTCSACHLRGIQGAGQTADKGIAVFNLPGMDIETLCSKGFVTGYWPEDADARLSVFMRLLLANDAKAVSALAILGKTDTLDLRKADAEQLQASTDLIWAIKKLLLDLQQQGHAGLKNRLEQILKTKLESQQFASLINALPPALANEALTNWMPNLSDELDLYRQGDTAKLIELGTTKPEIKASPIEQPKTKSASDDLLLGGDLLSGDEDLSEDEADETPKAETVSEEEWVSAGGWYRSYYTLYYRPTAHADLFLKNWLDLTADSRDSDLQAIFHSIAKPKAQGLCLKCHSQSKQGTINWQGSHAKTKQQHFTRFTHDKHLAIQEIKNCVNCHQFSPQTETDDESKTVSPSFKPITKSQCSSCHSDGKIAGESCLSCHNYHIGNIELKSKPTEISVFVREDIKKRSSR